MAGHITFNILRIQYSAISALDSDAPVGCTRGRAQKIRISKPSRMEVMLWEVLSRKGRKRCASISTKSLWPEHVIKEGRNNDEL
jgi:hypothetical protein